MKWLWLAAPFLLAVADLIVWVSLRDPTFVVGIAGAIVVALYKALAPVVAKRSSPEVEAARNEVVRQGGSVTSFEHKRRNPNDHAGENR